MVQVAGTEPAIIATVVGIVLGALVRGFVGSFRDRDREARGAIEGERRRREELQRQLAEEFGKIRIQVTERYDRLKDRIADRDRKLDVALAEIRARLDIIGEQVTAATAEVSKQSGRLDDHMGIIVDHVSTLRSVGDKLNAVFRYIDEPRPTDRPRDS